VAFSFSRNERFLGWFGKLKIFLSFMYSSLSMMRKLSSSSKGMGGFSILPGRWLSKNSESLCSIFLFEVFLTLFLKLEGCPVEIS
jgi:hypothetical protein